MVTKKNKLIIDYEFDFKLIGLISFEISQCFGLLVFPDEKVADRQKVEPGVEKAGDGVIRPADDWFAADVEGGVDQNRAPGL